MLLKPLEIEKERPVLDFPLCFAKTRVNSEGTTERGIDVFTHCKIVGHIAKALVNLFPSAISKDLFASEADLIASVHDVGKISPTFQEKIRRAIDNYIPNSEKALENINPEIERNWGGHAGTSLASLQKIHRQIAEIAGRHHGFTPPGSITANDSCIGGIPWQNSRIELINKLKKEFQSEFPEKLSRYQLDVLSGLTTVADWIGSGSFFEHINSNNWNDKILKSIDNAGFIQPSFKKSLSFQDIFGFTPRPSQTKLIETTSKPGVYILEAPMGLGKTEAALYAAYQLLESGQATGLYFALPTQLTSNKIHQRVTHYLNQILDPICPHRQALLLHGNAWLQHTELGEEGQPGCSWFNSSKRGLLAPFAVGTIDQALMAVMNVKHGFVRTFGLAGKVIILDEVHTYDSYTGTLLDALVKELNKLHCTVIILSATLTQNRRATFLNSNTCTHKAYPLISAKPKNSPPYELEVEPIPNKNIQIVLQNDFKTVESEALLRAEQGQQVLWIENTVAEAQAIYRQLKAKEMNIEVGLLHSRFLKTDRETNEEHWVQLFGKEGHIQRQKRGRILVGTQVLEQSLDIDADFLITRICPTDMLLQRLGRLWRHEETNGLRPEGAKNEAWILAPSLETAIENPRTTFGKTANVYLPYVLCRTLEVWQDRHEVSIPSQIRDLIEQTYAPRQEQGNMAKYLWILEQERSKLENFARIGLSQNGKTLSEKKASTRHSDQESCEVLLVRTYKQNSTEAMVTLLNGTEITLPKGAKQQNAKAWKETAALLTLNTVTVPEYLAPTPIDNRHISLLGQYLHIDSKDDDNSFRIGWVTETNQITTLDNAPASTNFKLEYRSDYGYDFTPCKSGSITDDAW